MLGFVEIIQKCKNYSENKNYNKLKKETVNDLTSAEKGLLIQFFYPESTDVIYVELADHIAQYLLTKGIIVLLSSQGRYGYFERIPVRLSNEYADLVRKAYIEQNT